MSNYYTLYLNSEVNTTKYAIGSKNLSYTFDVPSIIIKNKAKLKVFLLTHTGTTNGSIITFKLKDVNFNGACYYSNDISYPTIFCGQLNGENNYYTGGANGGGYLELTTQAINTITILTTDSLTNINSGISNGLKFIIGIVIEDFI